MINVGNNVIVCLDDGFIGFEPASVLEILVFGVFLEDKLVRFFKKSSLILAGEKCLAKLEIEKFAEFEFDLFFLDI